jgi:hypothetical protein
VVEAGEIIERGNHEELYASQGRYYDLYTRQHGLETNLFLAPGEGDAMMEDKNGSGQKEPAIPNAMNFIRGNI